MSDPKTTKQSSVSSIKRNVGRVKSFSDIYDITTENFKILKKFVKKPNDIDSQLAGMTFTDGLQLISSDVQSCIETSREALTAMYSEDYTNIITGYTDGMIRIINCNSMNVGAQMGDENVTSKGPCTSVKHRPFSKFYSGSKFVTATYTSGWVKCWNHETKEIVYSINENRQLYNITYHPRSPKFVTCGDNGRICLYDEESKTQERIFQSSTQPGILDGHGMRVFATVFHPINNFEFISGGWDNVIHFWDLRQQTSTRHISGPHICGEGLDISNSGNEILTCSYDFEKQLNIWDYKQGTLIKSGAPDQHNSMLYCGKFLLDNFAGSGGTNPNLFRIVDLRTFTTLGLVNNMPGGVYCVDVGNKNMKKKEAARTPLHDMPRLLISAGKRIYQIDFN